LAGQKESRLEKGHLMPDHVHMLISIPPKYAVSQVVGFIKGKSASIWRGLYGERKRNFVGQHFSARGYFVTTVGSDEATIREWDNDTDCRLHETRFNGEPEHQRSRSDERRVTPTCERRLEHVS
jgi:putative transposase